MLNLKLMLVLLNFKWRLQEVEQRDILMKGNVWIQFLIFFGTPENTSKGSRWSFEPLQRESQFHWVWAPQVSLAAVLARARNSHFKAFNNVMGTAKKQNYYRFVAILAVGEQNTSLITTSFSSHLPRPNLGCSKKLSVLPSQEKGFGRNLKLSKQSELQRP